MHYYKRGKCTSTMFKLIISFYGNTEVGEKIGVKNEVGAYTMKMVNKIL